MGKTYTFTPAERQLYEDIANPDNIAQFVPRIAEAAEGAAMIRSMHEEIGTLGKFHRTGGFDKNRLFQRVAANIDEGIFQALNQLDPAIFKDRKKFYAMLNGPLKAFDVRGKITL